MKRLISILLLLSSLGFSQQYDFQELCLACAEANGFYCGDDPTNWTQYSPNGCVQSSWINDGWEDCVDAGDENGAVPTSIEDCAPPEPECDTVYVEIPVIEYEYITEYIYEVDTVYVDVIQFIELFEYIDCNTGLPCGIGMEEILDKSMNTGFIYNLQGKVLKKPEGIYIEEGKVKYKIN